MKKLCLFICLVLLGQQLILAANNIAYLRESSGSWYLGTINGATLSALDEVSLSYAPVIGLNGSALLKEGDFNGDGISDVAVVLNPLAPVVQIYDLSSLDSGGKLLDVSLTSLVSDCSTILDILAGDFDNDGIDELSFVYNHTDGNHQTQRTNNILEQQNISYKHLTNIEDLGNYTSETISTLGYGTLLYSLSGDFWGLGYDQIGYIYNNEDDDHHTYKVFNVYTGQFVTYRHLSNETNDGLITFAAVCDYDGDGTDEIAYVSEKSGDDYQRFKYYDHPNWSNELLISKITEGTIINLIAGNFNDDSNGTEEICYIFDNIDGDHVSQRVIENNSGTLSKVYDRHLTTLSEDAMVRISNVGDFNGDGRPEIGYLYRDNGNNEFLAATYDHTSLNFEKVTLNYEIVYAVAVGITTKIISRLEDQTYSPIPLYKTGIPINTFNFGWYTDATNNAVYWDQLKNNSPTNSNVRYTETVGGTRTDFDNYKTYITDMAAGSNNFPKVTFADYIPTQYMTSVLPVVYNSSFVTHFNELDAMSEVVGHYIGDDFYPRCERTASNPNSWYEWEQHDALFNLVNANSNKYTFVAENSLRLVDAYNDGRTNFHVPMLEEYLYRKVHDTPSENNYTRVSCVDRIYKINKLIKDPSNSHQPGFIYIAQAHGEQVTDPTWTPRIANWEELRYSVFNAIIHGAGGIFIWSYSETDISGVVYSSRTDYPENIVDNIYYNISNELSLGSIPAATGSLLDALKNGHVNDFNVFSDKDGFNSDANTVYEGMNPKGATDSDLFGKNISDLNYIVRQSGNTYYLLTVNNSNQALIDVEYYLPLAETSGKYILEVCISSDGTLSTNSPETKVQKTRDGITYCTFVEDILDPFKVKIYRINTSNTFSLSKKNDMRMYEQDDVIPSTYGLSQNYPNPFNPETSITYTIPLKEHITLTVYNMLGQKVKTLVDGIKDAGVYSVNFNANELASGVYFYTLKTENYNRSKKLILLK